MKKVALLIFVLAGISFNGVAQEQKENTPERIKLYPVTKTQRAETPEQEIARLENHLVALDEKESWIRSNPEELQKANENGWFEDANQSRKEIKARLIELKK